MKGKKFTKVLALILAFVMIFSTFSIIAYADTEEPYVVSYGAPAVLMNEKTMVNLNDIYVEMKADGTKVSGAEIVWSASNQSGLVFDEFAKTIYAEKVGRYKLTATANGITKNVWVLVKIAEQEDFYLVKFDSFSADTFNAADWRMMKKKTTTIKELSGYEIKDGYFKTPHDHASIYVGDEIFNDFADYTVTAYVSNTGAKTVGSSGGGTVGRMVYTEGATTYAGGIISFVRQNKSIGVANPASMGNSFPQVGPTGSAPWDGLNDYHTLKTIYDGEIVEFCFDDWSVLSNSDADYPCTGQTQAGYPGIMAYDSNTYVKNFSVKLNNNTLAPTYEKVVNTYTVKYASPAIPMNANTAVDLKLVNVEMDANGTVVTGDKIVWDAQKQDGLYLNKDANKVTVYKPGQYKLTATANGVTKNIWIIAKNAGDDKFYLAKFDSLNQNTFVASEWRTFAGKNDTEATAADVVTAGSDYIRTPQSYGGKSNGRGIVYVAEIFKDFADYTVEGYMSSEATATAQAVTNVGSGVLGRINLNDAETKYASGIVSYVRQTEQIGMLNPTTTGSYTGYGTSVAWNGTSWQVWKGANDYHTVKVIYEGSKTLFYYGDGENQRLLFDSSTKDTCYANTQTGAGYPGLMGYGASARYKTFYVYLNYNETPDALAPETAPEEEQVYKVYSTSPAIPMNAFTVLNTENIAIEIDGSFVNGSDITFTPAEDYSNIEIKDGKITAYAAGTYKITAKYGETSATVYVVVKNAEDKQFVIYSEEFGDYTNITTFPSNWKSQWRQDGMYGSVTQYTWYDYTEPRAYSGLPITQSTEGPGIVPFSNNKSWNSAGYFTLSDEIVSDFSDYTVIATMVGYSNFGREVSGYGVFARANTFDGKLTNNSTLTGVYSASHNDKQLAQKIESAPGEDDATPTITYSTISDAWDYTNRNNPTASVTFVGEFKGNSIATYIQGDNQKFTTTTENTQKGSVGVFCGMVGDSNISSFVNLRVFTVALNNAADDMPIAEEIKMYAVESFDPVIVMYNNTSATLKKIVVQLADGGESYLGNTLTWSIANATNDVEITNGENGKIVAYSNGTYVLNVTNGKITKKIYLLVTDKGRSEVVLFNDDFSNGTLDYSVWQQTEYYWGTPVQVTAQKPLTSYICDNGVDQIRIGHVDGETFSRGGAVPFVTTDYWDAITLGGPRSRTEAGGTGYEWNKVFMNNAYYYAYIREDYVTADGIKLSDLGVYDVSVSLNRLYSGRNISAYTKSTDVYGDARMEYNGIGIMGRVNFAGESYFNKGTSSMQSFIWDGNIRISAGSATSSAATSNGMTSTSGTLSLRAEYRSGKITGTYISIANSSGYFSVPSFTTELKTNNGTTGSVGFYTEGVDVDIYDFTVTYPVSVPDYNELSLSASDNTITVPLNTTVDLTKYSFTINGKTVKGSDMAWSGIRNNIGELDALNNSFTGFSVGSTTVNGVTFVVSDSVSTLGTKQIVNVTGNGDISIAPNNVSNSYIITASADNGYLLKAGVITVTYADGTVKTVGVDGNGKAAIATDYIGNVKISAEFTEAKELGFVSLGATIRLPGTKDANGNTLKHGIKFGARINNIRLGSGKPILDAEVTFEGNNYKVAEVGSIIVPTQLLFGSELTVDSPNATRKKVTVVSNATENFADITAVLVGIPETWYGTDISFRGYMKLTNLDGTGEFYVYTDEISRSYNGVMKVAPVTATGVEYNTDNTTVMLTSAKANLKYALGEQMVVFADTYIDGTKANGVKLKYSIYKGDTNGYTGSAVETGTLISSANTSSKIIYTSSDAGYYYVVVSALDTNDNIVISDTIRLGTGLVSAGGTSEFDDNNIAVSFGVSSDIHIMGEYMNSTNSTHLKKALKILNNQAGYYSDGTQKLDAYLVAGDLTNAVIGTTNTSGLPRWASATTALEYNYLIYSEANELRNVLNTHLGDTQFFYSMGNHDSHGMGFAGFSKDNFYLRSSLFYQQMFAGKRVELPDVSGLEKNYDKSLLFAGMTEAEKNRIYFNRDDDYTDSKDYIKYFGRDEETAQEFNHGNRVMKINGYTFISIEFMKLQNGYARYSDETLRFLKNALEKSVIEDPSAPIFIITHFRPYGTEGYMADAPQNGSVNFDEILKDYPQAFVWSGHIHDSINFGSAIVQTRLVDEEGNVINNGYTSLSTGATAQLKDVTFGDGSTQTAGFTQLVQVDINGNVKITRYYIAATIAEQGSVVTTGDEIVKGTDGQWIKSWNGGTSDVVTRAKVVNEPWFITNAIDDNIRDEYAPDVRSAVSKPQFTGTAVTVSNNGLTVTFPRAVNALGVVNECTTIMQYRAYALDADGNVIEKVNVSRYVNKYANCTEAPDPDTYSVTFTKTPVKVMIRAFDCWAAFKPHDSYSTLIVDIASGTATQQIPQ